jgi:hypothetical protein
MSNRKNKKIQQNWPKTSSRNNGSNVKPCEAREGKKERRKKEAREGKKERRRKKEVGWSWIFLFFFLPSLASIVLIIIANNYKYFINP